MSSLDLLSKRVKSLKPSPTLALAAKAKAMQDQGEDVISLTVGEPDWDTFESIKKAGIKSIQEGHTKYTPAAGIIPLRKAICQQTNQDLNLDYTPEEVTVSTGGKFIIFSLLQAVLDPGDEVLIPAPYWVSYPTQVELAEGKPIIVPTSKASCFKLDPETLEQYITPKTKLLILNSPSNPTGNMYNFSELKALSEILLKYPHVCIMSDDIYNRLVFAADSEASVQREMRDKRDKIQNETNILVAPHILQVEPRLRERTFVLNGASKTYSMTGWRLGWALGPKEVIGAMTKYQSQSVSCASPFTQEAVLHAILGAQDELQEALGSLKERCEESFLLFSKIQGVEVEKPQGAFYLWPDISQFLGKSWRGHVLETSKEFAQYLLEGAKVAVVPGIEFGLDGYMRVSYALDVQKMKEAVQRIEKFISEIK